MAQESKTASKRQKTLERELEWVRQGAKGRQTKQKARLNNYDKLMSQDQKQLDEKLEIYIPNGPRLGRFRENEIKVHQRKARSIVANQYFVLWILKSLLNQTRV